MKRNFQLLLVSYIMVFSAYSQNRITPALNIGSAAPALKVREWIKDNPIQDFERGKIYVVDFWATWCKPCLAAAPHLSALAGKYKGKVIFCDIDVKERKNTPTSKIKASVQSMGDRMNFHVAIEDSNYMEKDWLDAFGEQDYGIPRTFVVNATGKIAWIGHPAFGLDTVLEKIVNNNWDIKKALTKRNFDRHLEALDDSTMRKLNPYVHKPDSALIVIKSIINDEPELKYAPQLGYYTFLALLKTNPQKAYEFGKKLIVTTTYTEPAYEAIINGLKYSGNSNLPAEIYQLCAEARQEQINHYPYPEIVESIPSEYNEMAEWYWRANDKPKAIEAEEKAIKLSKNYSNISESDLASFKHSLRRYKM